MIIERTWGRYFSRVGWEASSERQSSRTPRSSSGKVRSSLCGDIKMRANGVYTAETHDMSISQATNAATAALKSFPRAT